MILARNVAMLMLSMGSVLTLGADDTHQSLEGTWYLDKAHSQYPAESATEVILQHGDMVDITLTENGAGRPNNPMQIRLSTSGKPTVNTVGPNTFTSTTRWDHGKLVTFVEGDRGQHMTEVRELSPDGKTLTVTGYHQDELKKPHYVRVMTKTKP
jgi:hypothetical protein